MTSSASRAAHRRYFRTEQSIAYMSFGRLARSQTPYQVS
jgi:hypothetical protein